MGTISFIDTPGHAAFSEVRARGANSTDIVILVVAADDGLQPQTEEAISHARAAEVPIVVAVNKMDREEADIEKVKTELSNKELIPEDWGGQTQFVPISALKGDGIKELLEAVSLEAEVLELKAHHKGPAFGVVLSSKANKSKIAIKKESVYFCKFSIEIYVNKKKTPIDNREKTICLIKILLKFNSTPSVRTKRVNQETKLKIKNIKKIDTLVPSGPSKVIFLSFIQLSLQTLQVLTPHLLDAVLPFLKLVLPPHFLNHLHLQP